MPILSDMLANKINRDFMSKVNLHERPLPIFSKREGVAIDDTQIIEELDLLLKESIPDNIQSRSDYYYIVGPFPFFKQLMNDNSDLWLLIDTKEKSVNIAPNFMGFKSKLDIHPGEFLRKKEFYARIICVLYTEKTKGSPFV